MALLGGRQRHRDRAAVLRSHLHGVPAAAHAGRVSGHRHRPRNMQESRRAPPRTDLGRVRVRQRQHVPIHASQNLKRRNMIAEIDKTAPPVEILLVEDNLGDARLTREALKEGKVYNNLHWVKDGVEALDFLHKRGKHQGAPNPDVILFDLVCVGRLSQGLEYLATRSPSLVLLDLSLPDSYGFDTFLKVYAPSPKVPIIVLTGYDDQTVALSAVKTGAQDYLVKGKLDRELLLRSMQYSIERKRYQEQLEHQANYDALTGPPNRNLLHGRLSQSVFAQRYVRSIGVVFLDIDHFKFVNDSLGHNTGDKLLQKVAERLTETVRDGDTVARLGGDEFILILNDQTGQEVIYRAMQRIISKVADPIDDDGQVLMGAGSASISLYPQDGSAVDTLLKKSDAAMYRAKEKGRNN